MNVQFKKGVLELLVLSLLSRKDMYGYEISDLLAGEVDISDGTVYPILRKLKSLGMLTTYLSENSGGPPRKYYKITKTGQTEFESIKHDWEIFSKSVNLILGGKNFE